MLFPRPSNDSFSHHSWLSNQSERLSLVKGSLNDAENGGAHEGAAAAGSGSLFARKYWSLLVLGTLLGVAQQWTGINAIMFYAPKIFTTAGIASPLIPTLGMHALVCDHPHTGYACARV